MILIEKMARQGFPCLFHRLTGLYCPGCGGTRAINYLLHGQIVKSIQYHPLVLYMAFVIVLESVRYLWSLKSENPHYGDYEAEVYGGIGIIIINWAAKNWALLCMGIDLLP